ncbi:LOB domain-containing protein 41 [Hibiscus syriacus]|uniref:LOB domain-containing protein 41 n=1 Tax=Hibiscus syriacus TaxID=106335 RepID=A0A6A2WIW9_HIBSY|nr:LOB domain-containing protein 40-like [Hibiscus syriacus]KAE8659342.1 LOB domain-containing protein 41 [Hibiscus syriacus]
MRMSCNGCRILRKGCSENCSIRPCLQWIKSPESQANATVFLAKFYGRAGLMNLINAGPEHLRHDIFRSLLYEACGRIVNPIYGSVGLLWSGSWQLCQAAVEAVLKGAPIIPIASEAAANGQGPPLKAYDIRHVSKDENSAASNDVQRVKTRCRVKRTVKPKVDKPVLEENCEQPEPRRYAEEWFEGNRSTSHESSLSHQSELAVMDGESKETESMISEETVAASRLFPARPEFRGRVSKERTGEGSGEMGLELTLGFKPVASRGCEVVVPVKKRRVEALEDSERCKVDLGLDYPAA